MINIISQLWSLNKTIERLSEDKTPQKSDDFVLDYLSKPEFAGTFLSNYFNINQEAKNDRH